MTPTSTTHPVVIAALMASALLAGVLVILLIKVLEDNTPVPVPVPGRAGWERTTLVVLLALVLVGFYGFVRYTP